MNQTAQSSDLGRSTKSGHEREKVREIDGRVNIKAYEIDDCLDMTDRGVVESKNVFPKHWQSRVFAFLAGSVIGVGSVCFGPSYFGQRSSRRRNGTRVPHSPSFFSPPIVRRIEGGPSSAPFEFDSARTSLALDWRGEPSIFRLCISISSSRFDSGAASKSLPFGAPRHFAEMQASLSADAAPFQYVYLSSHVYFRFSSWFEALPSSCRSL